MYREPGAVGVLKGVLSGPHTGGAREIDVSRLSRPTHDRLTRALAGRGDSAAIIGDHGGRRFSTQLEIAMALGGVTALAGLFALGYGERASRFGLHPSTMIVVWAMAASFVAVGALSMARRRARVGRAGGLTPGRYLLPLDLVEVRAPEEGGRQIAVVRPLGDARDARIDGRKLHLTFADGTATDLWIGDRDVEALMRRLEHAQSLLEDLTFNANLERRVATDPFFEVRVDESWAEIAPSGPVSDHAPTDRLHGRFGSAVAIGSALAVAGGGFALRNWLGDDALFVQALHDNTPEALDMYLAHGNVRHAPEALGIRDVLAAQKEHRNLVGPPASLVDSNEDARKTASETCIDLLRAKSSPAHPEVVRIMTELVALAESSGDPIIPIRFSSAVDPLPTGVPDLELESREITIAWAFERVFSETCPANLIQFSRKGALDRPGLDVRYNVSFPNKIPVPGSDEQVVGVKIGFDVALHGQDNRKASFVLTMSPPEKAPTELRTRSLFLLGSSAGAPEDRPYRVMTARAFDRLYDEMYGLFFAGEVRVPLRAGTSALADK